MPRQRSEQVSIYLLKESITQPGDALKDADKLRECAAVEAIPEGVVYIMQRPQHPPAWRPLVQACTSVDVSTLTTTSPAAVLFLPVDDRWFAFTFGHARHLLAPEAYVRGFGLHVALVTAEPDSIGAVDSAEYDSRPIYRRASAAKKSPIGAFDLDYQLDLLRGVTAAPADTSLGTQVSGRDALKLWIPITAEELPALCRRLFAHYGEQIDRQTYPMVGNVEAIRDPEEIAALDAELVAKIVDQTAEVLYLAPPDAINWELIDGFRIPARGRAKDEVSVELMLDDFLSLAPESGVTIEWLKGKQVLAVDQNGNDTDRWSAYSCVVAEIEHEGSRFALFAGDWFRIAQDFVEKVATEIGHLDGHRDLAFASLNSDEKEGEYNQRVSAADPDRFVCMDAQVVHHGGGRSQVEVCDVLDVPNAVLYHIKDKKGSASLSHLFAQASVSAELTREDPEFRRKVREKFGDAISNLFPDGELDTSRYTIVLGVISSDERPLQEQLPFFGRVRLVEAAKTLRRLGFTTKMMHIQRQGQ